MSVTDLLFGKWKIGLVESRLDLLPGCDANEYQLNAAAGRSGSRVYWAMSAKVCQPRPWIYQLQS